MRGWPRSLAAALLLAPCACGGGRVTPPPAKTNVLLVILDDMSYRIGLYGYDTRTPSLERLARRGRRFDHAYCQYPLCSPSRTSLLTGWSPEKTKVWGNLGSPRANLAGATPLPEHFRANGYFTARLGKIYHSRFEREFSWDLAEDSPAAPEAGDEGPPLWQATDRADAEEPDGRLARKAADLIERKKDVPFFIGVGFDKPHSPWMAPRPYFDLYPPERMSAPSDPPRWDEMTRRIRAGAAIDVPPRRRNEARAAYAAAATFADAQVGVILDALDRLDLWKKTVVVVVGDNGLHVGEHGLWGKTTLFEESARVPLVLAAPGLARPGEPTSAIVELLDLYPTLVELASLPEVEGVEGTSLAPLLADPESAVKGAAFTIKKTGAARKEELARSVRTERYRFTAWPDGSTELYDHRNDPDERSDLSRDPAQAATARELRALLAEGRSARAAVGGPRPFAPGTGQSQ